RSRSEEVQCPPPRHRQGARNREDRAANRPSHLQPGSAHVQRRRRRRGHRGKPCCRGEGSPSEERRQGSDLARRSHLRARRARTPPLRSAIPPERRMLNALKGLAATRHGEAAGLRWCNRFPELQPLGKLVVARSYDKDGTKTQVSRQVPIHPVLAQLLNEWWSFGWASVYGRRPTLKDYIVPRSI